MPNKGFLSEYFARLNPLRLICNRKNFYSESDHRTSYKKDMQSTGQGTSWRAASTQSQVVTPLRPNYTRRSRQLHAKVQALNIDRRMHLELSWKRQQEREARLAQLDLSQGSNGTVLHVEDLEHLEQVLDKAGTSLVILFFTSRTCGVCKDAAKRFETMCKDASASRARVVFLQTEIFNEYDYHSDIAVWYNVKAVPTFLFLDEGALIRRLSLRDIRQMAGSSEWIKQNMAADMRKLRDTFTEVLFKRAPGAR